MRNPSTIAPRARYRWGSAFDPSNKYGTVEAWINLNEYNVIVGQLQWSNTTTPPPAGYIGKMHVMPDGHLEWYAWPSTGGPWPSDPPPRSANVIPLGEWTHIAVTWSPSGTDMYVNGVLDATSTGNWYPALNSTFFVYMNSWGAFDMGLVDEFRISKVARSGAEILAYVQQYLPTVDFEGFGAADQGARFGVDPPVADGLHAGLDFAFDAATKIATWGSFTVQDSTAPGGNDSTGASIPGADGSENWLKGRASSVGKGAKITRLPGECFEFGSMRLFTQDHPAFIDEVTVTWRTCDGVQSSAPLVLTEDTWVEVTADDLGIAEDTLLKTMWFNGAPSNPDGAKFGLDDLDVTIVAAP